MKSRKIRKQSFVVDNGTYPFDVAVFIGHSHKEICDFIEKRKNYKLSNDEFEILHRHGKAKTTMLKGGQTILQITNEVDDVKFKALLAHEIFHAVEFLMEKIGSKYNIESGETWAYQIEYLTGSIYEKLK
jgi:hypothetical protein